MTLIEVLFTMAIMAVGMVSVASIFPVAAKLQDDAAGEILAEQASRNAEAMIKARGFRVSSTGGDAWWNPVTPSATLGTNNPFYWNCNATLLGLAAPTATAGLSLRDRSYPSSLCTNKPDPVTRQPVPGNPVVVTSCDFFWVPLVRNADPRLGRCEPQCAVFVMRRAAVAPVAVSATVQNTNDANYDTSTGVPVAQVATTAIGPTNPAPVATTATASGLGIGDLVLYGPVPLGVLNAQWSDASDTPTLDPSKGLQWEVLPQTNPGVVGYQPGYRSNPANYTGPTNLFNPALGTGSIGPSGYAQVFSGTKAVTYRVILVSGDMLIQR